MMRRYGLPPWRAAVLHGGPGAPGTVACVARELGKTAGTLEPIQSRHSVTGILEELEQQLRGVAHEPFLLIGHSWGAWLALLYAARHPLQVRRGVLIGSAPLDTRYVPRILEKRRRRWTAEENEAFDAAIAALETPTNKSQCDDAMRRLDALTRQSDNYALREPLPEEACDVLPADAAQYAALWPEAAKLRASGGLLDAARRLSAPVTVLHGEDDPHPAEGVVRPLVEMGLDVDTRIFSQCGHSPFLERHASEAFSLTLNALMLQR